MNLFSHYHTMVKAVAGIITNHAFREELLNEIVAMMKYERGQVGEAYSSDVGYDLDTAMMVLRSCYAPKDQHIQTHSDVKRRLRLALVVLGNLEEKHPHRDDVPELRDAERQSAGYASPARDMDDIPF